MSLHAIEAHNEVLNAAVFQIIQTVHERGDGTQENPRRNVIKIWTVDGRLLAESDPQLTYCEHCKVHHFTGLNQECRF